ncbi:hypothetical protein [Endozoicomonas sp.]|uniref:hypothetical protein n=1 Tax=Endozoicomonas sp. TaxID=1892382 RepID=UPI003AF996C1
MTVNYYEWCSHSSCENRALLFQSFRESTPYDLKKGAIIRVLLSEILKSIKAVRKDIDRGVLYSSSDIFSKHSSALYALFREPTIVDFLTDRNEKNSLFYHFMGERELLFKWVLSLND